MNNSVWAYEIIHQLTSQGVIDFCLGSGSRSTPLVLAAAHHPAAKIWAHFDERGLGFFALGLAKSSKRAVAIIVTSGTAVGNLFPAVMEAFHDNVPLILLTADRPPELRDCGANQTTDQVKLFSSFVHWQVDLPCPFPSSERYLASTLSYAIHLAKNRFRGPVQINCMLREPLHLPFSDCDRSRHPHSMIHQIGCNLPDPTSISTWTNMFQGIAEGIIVCGHTVESIPSAVELTKRLQWPLFADITSPLRPDSHPFYEWTLHAFSDHYPQAILHLGGRIVSKKLLAWFTKACESNSSTLYCQVDDSIQRFDPSHCLTHRFDVEPEAFCKALLTQIPQNEPSSWKQKWDAWGQMIQDHLDEMIPLKGALSEPALVRLLNVANREHLPLFCSNSMPIRDANSLIFSTSAFANRGLSGIDGNIATAAGIAQGMQKATIALLGDLTTLHDLNSLAFLSKNSYPLFIVIINNGGGGIFSFLPIAGQTEHFEELLAHAHEISFRQAAQMFGLPYHCPDSLEDLASLLNDFREQPCSCIVEVKTERSANYDLHQKIQQAVCSIHYHENTTVPSS